MIIVDSSCSISSFLLLPSNSQNHTLILLKTAQINKERYLVHSLALSTPVITGFWKAPVTSPQRSLRTGCRRGLTGPAGSGPFLLLPRQSTPAVLSLLGGSLVFRFLKTAHGPLCHRGFHKLFFCDKEHLYHPLA